MLELVVIILGIIVAGGFLLYFLGDILMGMANKGKKDQEIIRKKQVEQTKNIEERLNALENGKELRKDPAIATILLNGGGMVEEYNPDEDELAEGEEETVEENQTQEVEELIEDQEVEVEEAAENEEETEEAEDDIADYIAKRRQELMEKLARIKQEAEGEEQDELKLEETEDDESDDITDEETEDDKSDDATDEETEAVEEASEEKEIVEQVGEEKSEENIQPEKKEVVEESKEEVQQEIETPVEAPVETTVEEKVVVKTILGDLDELEEKLAIVQDKLKANEKELRRCKKEYIPLRKVKKTLEKDENKLRRKEALVAKQKVMLYGVNNYADIDEEKAKKLAEDLDLLDGLKLSVQHCHEVMDNNKERYPLLEQIYTLLVNKNNDLKNEVKSLQASIEKLKNEQ